MTLTADERARMIAARWQSLFERKLRIAAAFQPSGARPLKIIIEGTGNWVLKAYRPSLFRVADKIDLDVTYAYNSAIRGVVPPREDERWRNDRPKADWERFVDKKDYWPMLRKDRPDAVFVVTPDKTHCAVAKEWLRWSPLIFVEKPFDVAPSAVEDLIRAHGERDSMHVLGVDHYQLYATPLLRLIREVVFELGGSIAEIQFLMCENNGVEIERIATLEFGLTMDLLCHFIALLLPFTELDSLDEINILTRERYRTPPGSPQFNAETFSRTTFTAADCIEEASRFLCRATVGKGLSRAVKYVQLCGRNGRSMRIDFLKRPQGSPPWSRGEYPLESMFLIHGAEETGEGFEVDDPYHPVNKLHIIAPSVFGPDGRTATAVTLFDQLFLELARGGDVALSSTLLMKDAEPLVRFMYKLSNQMKAVPMNEHDFQTKDPTTV